MKVGLALAALGAALWLARWLVQGESTIYTDVARRFYVADATLGWVQTPASWVWLGLEGLGAIVGVLVGTGAMAFAARRFAAGKLGRVARVLAMAGAALGCLAPVLPAWAWFSGLPPADAEIVLPDRPAPIPRSATPIQARRLVVAPNAAASLLVVRIAAGEETFDARFGPVTGSVDLDTRAASIAVPAASIETGVGLRDSHAKGYLEADKFATIALAVHDIALGKDGELTAKGDLALMGRSIPVALKGTASVLAEAQRKELGIGAAEAVLTNASFDVSIATTALDPKNFDADRLVVTVRLVLVPASP
ncbi:MAG: YceI family protein [Myxococcota bacterium]